jgi:hypothetical protein
MATSAKVVGSWHISQPGDKIGLVPEVRADLIFRTKI